MDIIICNIPWYSGLSRYAMDVAEVLLKKGRRVFWATEKGTVLWEKLEKINVRPVALKGRSDFNFFTNLNRIKKAIRKNPPARIFAFTGSGLFQGYFLKRKCGSKLYRFRVESYGMGKNFLNKWLYSKCDLIIAGNRRIKEEIENAGIKKVRLLYAGVNDKKFSFVAFPEEKNIGYLGRLGRVKGIDILWKAMNIVWEKHPETSLTIAAGDTSQYRWEDIKDNFRGKVEYCGKIPEDGVPAFLAGCLFGVMPSLGSEATSRALLEWWATGRAVISSFVGMPGEVIENGSDGFLVASGNPEALAEKIIKLLSGGELLYKMGSRARKKVESEFSAEVFERNLISLLENER